VCPHYNLSHSFSAPALRSKEWLREYLKNIASRYGDKEIVLGLKKEDVMKVKKFIEKTIMLQRMELPFIKEHYIFFFRVGEEVVFVDPALVIGSIFTEKWELVFPCAGKLIPVGHKEYAVKAVSPDFTAYRLHLLYDDEDVPVSRLPYDTQTFRLGDRVFAYFVPLPEDEYEEDRWWDDDYDDYDDDED